MCQTRKVALGLLGPSLLWLLPEPALAATKSSAAKPAPASAAQPGDSDDDDDDGKSVADKIAKFDLPKGKMIDVGMKKAGKTGFAPKEKLLKPYASASVSPRLAFSLVDGRRFLAAPAAQQLLQQTVDRLLAAWEGPRPDIQVMVEARSGYAACATEQGVMFVPIGVFDPNPQKGVASTDELALLIGHELGHFLLRHLDNRAMRREIVDKLALAASGWVTYGAVKNTTADGNGRINVAADAATVRRAHLAGLAVTALVDDLLNPGFNRHSEVEADLFAIDLAKKAGYDVSESEIENMITRHAADAIEQSERMAKLQAVVQLASNDLGAKLTQKTGSPLGLDIGGVVNSISSKLVENAFMELAKSMKQHPDPALRLGVMKRYYAQAYAAKPGDEDQLVAKGTQPVTAVRRTAEITQTLGMIKRAEAEYTALVIDDRNAPPAAANTGSTDGQVAANAVKITDAQTGAKGGKSAAASKRPAAKGKPAPAAAVAAKPAGRSPLGSGTESYSSFVEGSVQSFRLSNIARADAAWSKSAIAAYPSLEGARYLAGDYAVSGARAQLIPLVEHLSKIFGTTDPIIDLVVGANVAKGDIAAAETLAARCVTLDGGSRYAFCALQLGYDPMQKGVSARTSEGQKAFAGKSIEKQFSVFSTLGGLFK